MADFIDAATRSKWMAAIRSGNTRPELLVRRWLHRSGLRFRLHARELPGTPDIVLPRHGVCIFVNGCFWHRHAGCRYARMPSTRTAFWSGKLERNVERDAQARKALRRLGWRVIDIWECGIKDVADPDLRWLHDAVVSSGRMHVVWPRRPPKAAHDREVRGSRAQRRQSTRRRAA